MKHRSHLLLGSALGCILTSSAGAGPKTETLKGDGASKRGGDSSSASTTKDAGAKRGVDMSDIPPDAAAEEKDLKALGEGFKVYRTMHFSILHDVSEADVKAFSTAIEKTYRSNLNYAISLNIEPKKPPRKLLIYYFNEHRAYSDYSKALGRGERLQNNPGVYFPDLNRSMFYNFRNQDAFKRAREESEKKVEELRKQLSGKTPEQRSQITQEINQAKAVANASSVRGGDQNEETVQHEVTHHILWNIGLHNKSFPANPRWFAEGTAMMFETAGTGKASNIGALNLKRLEDYRQLEKAGRLFNVREFISRADFFNRSETITAAYAEAWALAHYLNRTKRAQIKTFVETVNQRGEEYQSTPEKEIEAFERAFGKLDEKWVGQWKHWMKGVR